MRKIFDIIETQGRIIRWKNKPFRLLEIKHRCFKVKIIFGLKNLYEALTNESTATSD